MTTPIPKPRSIPFLGNVHLIDSEVPLRSFILLAKTYGEIFELNILGKRIIYVTSYDLANEVADESRFRKEVGNVLAETRSLVGDGLFSAHHDEPNWALAHRLLMPSFGQANIKNMLEDMRDIASQLLLKWERFGPNADIEPAADFTRMALDAITFCTLSYRLNSFYDTKPPPFAQAMADFLTESFHRSQRPTVVQALMPSASAKYAADIKLMQDVASKIIEDRRAHPIEKKDILNTMLYAKDPKTGQGLPEDNVMHNLLTFLVAGHETSSGMMSFITYYLLKNPEAMRKLRTEIDTVLDGRPLQYDDISKLPYLIAVMRESMRLSPPVAARNVTPLYDTTLAGGKYEVKAGTVINVLTYTQHRDPKVWGEDVEEFRPERMLDGKFEALPPNAWQPFGFGVRSCIGRPFAWQEVIITIASIIQKFDLHMADPSYNLRLWQTVTIKPKEFLIRASLRKDGPQLRALPSSGLIAGGGDTSGFHVTPTASSSAKTPIYVLYGSNTGTSEAFAQRIVNDAPSHGFAPRIGTLDSSTGHLPTDGPVVIVTASFEGQPADNAGQFVEWLTNLQGHELTDVRFAVFGCGNSDWVQTYQRIPILCDEALGKHGGKRLLERKAGDASQGSFFGVFDEFEANLWEVLTKEYDVQVDSTAVGFEVKTVDAGTERLTHLRQSDAALGTVVAHKVLTAPGAPVKLHLEFKLPEGQTYQAGDYIAIVPHNPLQNVRRVLAYFGLSEDHHVVVSSEGPTSLPIGKPISLSEILRSYVELSQPATIRDIKALVKATVSDSTKASLQSLIDAYQTEVLAKRISVLDLLEKYALDIKLSLSAFLRMLPPMRVRQYSISSSPLWNAEHVTLTISVIQSPALSGNTNDFLGVASNYLSQLQPGDRVQMSVRPSAAAFHPPDDPTTPVVMFCAGSGLAPMRGFIQERALQKLSGRDVGPMILFFGCRSPALDYLYGDSDLAEWSALGFLDVRPAFSGVPNTSEGCKHIQDRVWHDRELIVKAYKENAKLFTCGSGAVAKGLKSRLVDILQEARGLDRATAEAEMETITKGRYATDIFD